MGPDQSIEIKPVFQLIVGQRVTQAANDKQPMVPLVEAIEEQSGQKPAGVLADNGYCSDENLKYLAKKRMEGFVAAGKQKHSQRREPCKRGPYREKPAGSSAWNGSWKRRWGRRCMRHRGARLRADQTGTRVPSVSLTWDRKSTRRMGSDLHDPQYSEVSQDLFWVERQFPVPSVNGAAQRSDRRTQQSTQGGSQEKTLLLRPEFFLLPSPRERARVLTSRTTVSVCRAQ